MNEAEERRKLYYASLDRVIAFTARADAKASLIIPFESALIGAVISQADKIYRLVTTLLPWSTIGLALLIVAFAAPALAAIFYAIKVFKPATPVFHTSLIYFADIAIMGFEKYRAESEKLRPSDIDSQLLQQVHAVSKIAVTKFDDVARALRLASYSLVAWIGLIAVVIALAGPSATVR